MVSFTRQQAPVNGTVGGHDSNSRPYIKPACRESWLPVGWLTVRPMKTASERRLHVVQPSRDTTSYVPEPVAAAKGNAWRSGQDPASHGWHATDPQESATKVGFQELEGVVESKHALVRHGPLKRGRDI